MSPRMYVKVSAFFGILLLDLNYFFYGISFKSVLFMITFPVFKYSVRVMYE